MDCERPTRATFYAAVRRFRARRFLDAALRRRLLRRFGRDTDRLADRDTLALTDTAVEGAFGVAALRRRAARRRFFEDDRRFFLDVLRFLDRDTLALADLAVEGAFGVAALRRRAAWRRFFEDDRRFLERDLDADRRRELAERDFDLRRAERDRDTDGDLAFMEPVAAVDGATVDAIVDTDGVRGTDALRRRCRRRLDADARARLAPRLRRLLLRRRDVDGAFGVAARR